jgi:dinuclear metal center YbgI/SA1388 family protein
MKIAEIIEQLEIIAPSAYQENYDNAGLLTGSSEWDCTGVLVSLDATEQVVQEAIERKCNLIVSHHPILFSGLKKITGSNYVERSLIRAIKQDVALYAIHTNLDNVVKGVNAGMADRLGLANRSILLPKALTVFKLHSFVPRDYLDRVRNAIFEAGAGSIGDYSETSFSIGGEGSFKPGDKTNPFSGEIGKRNYEQEVRIETVFPAHLQNDIVASLVAAHPYEEVAYDITELKNPDPRIGSGLMGELENDMGEKEFLESLKGAFSLPVIRHTPLRGRKVRRVGVCGGAGSFLISKALAAGADFFISSDIKYHEFFNTEGRMVIADIGHYESEQFTIDLLVEILQTKFRTFAVLKTELNTNPLRYFI